MKSNFKHNLNFSVYGQSHDDEIGIIVKNIPSGYLIDFKEINNILLLRQGNDSFNTKRQEKLKYQIKSGFNLISKDNQAITNGDTIEVVFFNTYHKKADYDNILVQPRPGHVDYVAKMKYQDKHSIAGGGHFSGRLTLPLVFLGAVCKQILAKHYPNMEVISHINSFASYKDIGYYDLRKFLVDKVIPDNIDKYSNINLQLLSIKLRDNLHKIIKNGIRNKNFPTFNQDTQDKMYKAATKLEDDSLGGQIETIIINPPSFIGEPLFYSFESIMATLVYSIPSIKDISFGNIDSFKNKKGSQVKDEILYLDNKKLTTIYNNNGGINGGITNGEDIVFSTIVKPIASINQPQLTYNISKKKLTYLKIKGRHDRTIINRVIPVIDAVSYIVIYDLCLPDLKAEK